MLDLTVISKQLYEIKLLDGTVLKLKRPSQGLVEYIISLRNYVEDKDEEELVSAFGELFTRILNNNTAKKVFKEEELVEEYDFTLISMVIEDYFKYWNEEVADEVDFQ